MKKINQLLTVALIALSLLLTSSFMFSTSAQQNYTYLFSATPFTSLPSGGPLLEPIGTTMTPITVMMPTTTCPDTPTINLTYFQFNSGFKAKAFFSGTYSIEMIFRFEELNGYNRIIDFSNSISDYGIYTYFDCLNFYPTGSIGLCPGAFDTTNYKQIVITRNNITKDMNIYVNGSLFTNHTDATDYYVIGAAPNDSIKFFSDDLDVPNEASAGNVSLIRMCDFVLSPLDVTASYNNFCNRITAIQEPDNLLDFRLYPNPANNKLTIQLLNSTISKEVIFTVVNTIGQETLQLPLYEELTNIDLGNINPGVYFYQLQIDSGILKTGKIIVE